jgi:hypothetical protein
MTRLMRIGVPLLSFALLFAAPAAEAGWSFENAGCTKNADGSGNCWGNFTGFRNHVSPSTHVYIQQLYYGSRGFGYSYNNGTTTVSGWCSPNATVASLWPMLMAHRGYFNIYWDASGVCNELYLYHGSGYSDF